MRARRAIHTDSRAHGYTDPASHSLTFPYAVTDTGGDTHPDPDAHTSLHAWREFQRRLRACRYSWLGRGHGY